MTERSPGLSYADLLDHDTHEVPDFLRRMGRSDFGTADIPARFYFDPEIAALEKDRIWKRVWQFACREERLRNPGDLEVYEVADLSILLVRGEDGRIRGFWNSCLHRGRRLRDAAGAAGELQCQFHGFCWDLTGNLKRVPARWDFPQVTEENFELPQVRVDTWGGFVFVCLDDAQVPLHEYLGELTELDHWDLAGRYTEAHVSKVLPCNWKVAQEAFMESFHVVTTHPQLLRGIGDANSQYDAWDWVSRAITPRGTPSPHLNHEPTEQQIFDTMMGLGLDDAPLLTLPEDTRARTVIAAATRKRLAHSVGDRAATLSDSECVDTFFYTAFPNFHPWGSYNRTCYRFRPNGADPETSVMEILVLSPFQGRRPPEAPVRRLGLADSFLDAAELGPLARVFFQDEYNVGAVQRGLHSLVEHKSGVSFAAYQETKIRHFYEIYRELMKV
ncbi:MAG TPA: aromatic ring-hydroxylating dioxygenase subunit alpha [Sporichthyaceae bacterium]|nr:aromatic ring-hydroxylating dioxygenase subunit alpha [Sporichthyaceae bacterium]